MIPIEGVDLSSARPGGRALAAAGKRFVVRYLTGAGAKKVTRPEIDDYHAHGLDVAFVFESTPGRALVGRAAGAIDARASLAAFAALGAPPGLPVYFAVDFQAVPNQYPAIDAYLAGVASVLGTTRVGVYGHFHLMQHCASVHSAAWFWQTYAWSSGSVFPGRHLLQYRNGQIINGGEVDLCRAYAPSYGQWPAKTAPPAPHFHATVTTPTALWNAGTRRWVYNGRNAIKVGTGLVIRGAKYVKGGQECYPIVEGTTYGGYYVPVAHVTLGAKVS